MLNTKIISEIGINHNGSIFEAKKLIEKSAMAKADFAKFQIYKTENIVTRFAKKSNYQKKNSQDKETQFEMLKKYELSFLDHEKIFNFCKQKKIEYVASPFDLESYEFLKSLKPKFIKIGSGEITNYFLLKSISQFKGEIVLSTGMSTLKEIHDAVKLLRTKRNNITLLYCCSAYPAPVKDVDLNIMLKLKKIFKCDVGFSDHSMGIDVSVAAITLGAKYIEKHFTINKSNKGPDHKASINFNELKQLVKKKNFLSNIFKKGEKKLFRSELINRQVSRKSLVVERNINKGQIIKYSYLSAKRPGDGKSPMKIKNYIGKRAKKTYVKDEKL